MAVVDRYDLLNLSKVLQVWVTHFAQGTYPCNSRGAYPVNRCLLIQSNPGGEVNFIEDQHGHKHVMEKGWMYLVPAFHSARFQFDEETTFISIHFNLEFFRAMDILSRRSQLFTRKVPRILEKAQTIYSSTNNELPVVAEMKTLVFEISTICLADMEPEALRMAETFARYGDLISFILENCYADTTVEDMAKVMYQRRDVFTRKITADIGISPKRWFNRFLVNRASELLLQPESTAREVSYKLRFNSEYYFSRFFKQHTGLSPRNYQLQNGVKRRR